MTDVRLDRSLMTPRDGWRAAQSLVSLAAYAGLLWASAAVREPLLVLVVALTGLVQYRLYFPLYEASHNSLFTRPWTNRAMGLVLAVLLFTSPPPKPLVRNTGYITAPSAASMIQAASIMTCAFPAGANWRSS